jgi:hypothetical protein
MSSEVCGALKSMIEAIAAVWYVIKSVFCAWISGAPSSQAMAGIEPPWQEVQSSERTG